MFKFINQNIPQITLFRKTAVFTALLLSFSPLLPETIPIDKNFIKMNTGGFLEVFEDRTANMSPDEAMTSNQFKTYNDDALNFGFSSSAYWIKIKMKNTLDKHSIFLEYNYTPTDKIDLFYPVNGKYQKKTSGDHFPFSSRDISFRNPVFQIPLDTGENTVFLRVQTTSSVIIRIILYSQNGLNSMIINEQIILGLYYGIMFVMLINNMFVLFSTRDKNYLYYIIHIASFIIFQFSLNGLSFQYIWPNSIWWANNSLPFFVGMISMSGLLFTKSFLDTKNNAPVFDKILQFFIPAIAVSAFVSVFSYSTSMQSGVIIGLMLLITMLLSGVLVYRKGYKPAKYYLIAWIVFLIGSILKALDTSGIIPGSEISEWGQQIGSAIDVTLLSLALTSRIKILTEENEKRKNEIIYIQKSYNETLEETVEERTQELTKERNKLARQNRIMEYELGLARNLQEQMMPSSTPASYIGSIYKPMLHIGGDFFDFIKFKDTGKIGFFISDVSGHGVQSAFITSMIKTILMQSGSRQENPEELLYHFNEILRHQSQNNFITMYYCILDAKNKSVVAANAGHNKPLLITENKLYSTSGYKTLPISVLSNTEMTKKNIQFKNYEFQLPEKSKLFLYTDGLTECTPIGNRHEYFETSGLKDILISNFVLTGQPFLDQIYRKLLEFRGDDQFEDDICMICADID